MDHDELDELKEIFAHFDRDDNGVIDAEEFSQLLDALGAEMSDEEIAIGLSIVDANGNGQVEFDEFIAWWTSR
ncbi:MAG: EF-hand domain-containing protein [Myxococcota bacterium]